jgi:hypothetical protein
MDDIQCVICHKILSFGKIEYCDFLDDTTCKKCDKLFDLQKGRLNFDEIVLLGMRFDFVRNSFSENVNIKRIGSWRIGV